MTRKLAIPLFLLFSAVSGIWSSAIAQEKSLDAERHFTLNVLPILQTKCFACHGEKPDEIKGELDMTSRQSILKGGESGDPSIVIDRPDQSLMVNAIEWEDLEMPPKENDRLSEQQIQHVRRWITDGAVWPSDARQAEIKQADWADGSGKGETISTSGGTSDDWTHRRYDPEDVWAFKPVIKPPPPSAVGFSIDGFVDRKIRQAKLQPAGRADAEILVRRATYDLTGLPPTPLEIADFKTAYGKNRDQAWSALIDRLLASPRYGERWGQHWLDVVRYADTSGFSNDYERSNAWRYRDYVIRSFNEDKPYNRFVVEQIAGDELAAEQKTATNQRTKEGFRIRPSEGMIATGFLRMGPWEHTAMSPEKVSRQNYLDDIVNNLGQTFLSTAMRCCKCHDHKFDPLPTKDYYRLYAALATTQPAEMKSEFLHEENKSQFDSQRKHVERLLSYAKQHQDRLYTKRETAARQWYRERDREDEYVEFNKRRNATYTFEKPPRFIGLTTAEQGQLKVREQDVRIWTRRLERFEPLAQSVYNGGDLMLNSRKLRMPTKQQRLTKVKGLPVSFIYAGGNVFSPTDKVTPGVLSCLGIPTEAANENDAFALPMTQDGRRLTLARWVAHKDNPLTTRSIVNRIWHYHFGRGIAANPNNLGATGAKPTHPELLDWLAADFVGHGWSIKRLHRMIMKSDVYMRSSDHPEFDELQASDADNNLLAIFKPRRLTAEEIRDTMLAATGELNLEMGGLPIRPEINLEVALSPRMIQFSLAPAYQPDPTTAQRNRRSIYAYRIRGLRDPLMVVLDKPNPNISCEVRDSASTTPQVFTLLNSDIVTKRSIALALRLEKEADSIDARIVHGYELALGFAPSDELRQQLVSHYNDMVAYHVKQKPESTQFPTRITRSVVEEFSGDAFEYEELLDTYEDYVTDPGPADVSAETRALADICLLLFNSNEFMYVY